MDQRLRATKTAVLLRDACQRHRDGQRRDAVAERLRRPTMCERGHRSICARVKARARGPVRALCGTGLCRGTRGGGGKGRGSEGPRHA